MRHPDSAAAAAATMLAFVGAYGLFVLLLVLGSVFLTLLVNWRIAAKAGYPGGMSLLLLIPFVNIAALIVFAFSTWPVERRAAAAEGPDDKVYYHPPVNIGARPTSP